MVEKQEGYTHTVDGEGEKWEVLFEQFKKILADEPEFHCTCIIPKGGDQILISGHGKIDDLVKGVVIDEMLGSRRALTGLIMQRDMLNRVVELVTDFVNDPHARHLAADLRESMKNKKPEGPGINPDNDGQQ